MKKGIVFLPFAEKLPEPNSQEAEDFQYDSSSCLAIFNISLFLQKKTVFDDLCSTVQV